MSELHPAAPDSSSPTFGGAAVPSPSYKTAECCSGADCVYLHVADAGQCWGQVVVIDEEETVREDGTSEWDWIHVCQGHRMRWHGWEYEAEPRAVEVVS